MPDSFAVSDRTRVVREANRAVYDREAIYKILDEGFVCHVGFSAEGQPFVIPTMFARVGDAIYFHGSAASRMLRGAGGGLPVCITVTLVDSIVAGRSGFGMSMDYRSVVIFAKAEKITDFDEKERIVAAFVEDIMPGHKVRPPKRKEIAATVFLRFPLSEASAKIRDHGVMDPEEDHALEGWAGVVPLKLTAGTPRNCSDLGPDIPTPEYAKNYRR